MGHSVRGLGQKMNGWWADLPSPQGICRVKSVSDCVSVFAPPAVYEVPSDIKPDPAVLAPSSVETHQSAAATAVPRTRETKPATFDSGKDTQQLVEDDEYDC